MSQPFNEQAAVLIDTSLDLIKQVLVKHSAAVLEEMHDQIVRRNAEISRLTAENEALRKALEWYADEAKAIARHLLAKNHDAVMASVQVLALDVGRRADAAIKEES